MSSAVILVKVRGGFANEVGEVIAEIDGVSEVFTVAGRYDLAVLFKGKSSDDLCNMMTNHMQRIRNVESTETLIAFQIFSRKLLESGFSVGQ